jgi:hypothetical protein
MSAKRSLAFVLIYASLAFCLPLGWAKSQPQPTHRLLAPSKVMEGESFSALVVEQLDGKMEPVPEDDTVTFQGVVIDVEPGGRIDLPAGSTTFGGIVVDSKGKHPLKRHHLNIVPAIKPAEPVIESTSPILCPNAPFHVRGQGLDQLSKAAYVAEDGTRIDAGQSVGSSLERIYPNLGGPAIPKGTFTFTATTSDGKTISANNTATNPRLSIAGTPVQKRGQRGQLTISSNATTKIVLSGGNPQIALDNNLIALTADKPSKVGFTAEVVGPYKLNAQPLNDEECDEGETEEEQSGEEISEDGPTGLISGGGPGLASPPKQDPLPDCCIVRLTFTNDTGEPGTYEIKSKNKSIAKTEEVKPGESVTISGEFGKCLSITFRSAKEVSNTQVCCKGLGDEKVTTKIAGLKAFEFGAGTCCDDGGGGNPPPEVSKTPGTQEVVPLGIYLKRDQDNWIPANPSTTSVTARIYEKRGKRWTPSSTPKIIHFAFNADCHSKEIGECLNSGKETSFDLWFDQGLNPALNCSSLGDQLVGPALVTKTPKYCSFARTKNKVTKQTVQVSCEDFGAFSKITARADGCAKLRKEAGEIVECGDSPPVEEGCCLVSVPRDENNNQIADAFEDAVGFHPKADEDTDTHPIGRGKAGDGLPAYEEYRGFRVRDNSHIRTAWNLKDLFVHDQDGLTLGKYPSASGVTCHLITADQYAGNDRRVVNFNRGHAKLGYEQHGLHLVNDEELEVGTAGFTALGPPRKVVDKVRVKRSIFQSGIHLSVGALGSTIAHELGHATGITHHSGSMSGDNEGNVREIQYAPAGSVRKEGVLYSTKQSIGKHKLPHTFFVGRKHNNTSGDDYCPMRYHNRHSTVYEFDGDYELVPENDRSDQGAFCKTNKGSGVNANGHCAGDAVAGKCQDQIIINDE